MKRRQAKTIYALVASTLILFCLSSAFANTEELEHTLPSGCSSHEASTKQCMFFVKGYLDAFLQLNKLGLNPNFSDFEQRV